MKDNEKFFDVRVYKRYIKEEKITQKSYDKHIKSLPDVTDKAIDLVIEEEIAEEEED